MFKVYSGLQFKIMIKLSNLMILEIITEQDMLP